MSKTDASETLSAWEAAVAEAREFFGVDPLWRIEVSAGEVGGGAARIDASRAYFNAPITVDLDYYQFRPDCIRKDAAHEVAHLLTEEIWQLWRHLPDETSGDESLTGKLMRDAIESTTARLERLFLRERPEPVNVTLDCKPAPVARLGDVIAYLPADE